MEGYKVLGLSKCAMLRPATYKKIGADIYHSQSPNLMSTAAMIGEKNKKHVITCRDPRNLKDWRIELQDATWKRRLKNLPLIFFEEGPIVSRTVRKADAVGYAATYLKEKIQKMYGMTKPLTYLPNIEEIPKKMPKKSKQPTAIYIGRLDKRKRPEIYLTLAEKFPRVTFEIIGVAEDKQWQKELEKKIRKLPNIIMHGYIDKFTDKEKFYGPINKAWIFINTASREAYPLSFFEAAGRGCALLSHVNPDNVTKAYGYWAEKDDFEKGLSILLENDNWKKKGETAHQQFSKKHKKEEAIRRHLELYEKLQQKK